MPQDRLTKLLIPEVEARLVAGDDGYVYFGKRCLSLPPKEQAALHLLLTRAPDVVSKDEFAAQVWRHVEMSDESLTRCIHKIRGLLRQIPDAGKIVLLYGRGYRFEPPAEPGKKTVFNPRLLAAAQVPSPIAEAYLYARQLAQRRTAQALDKATQLLHEAIEKCPDFALARVALAECIAGGNTWGVNPNQSSLEEALMHLQKAERSDPHVAGLYSVRGYILDRLWRFDEAEMAFAKALHDAPHDVDTNFHYGWHLLAIGRADRACEALQTAVDLHPYTSLLRVTLARAHAHAGRPDEALKEAQKACDSEPGNPMARLYLTALKLWIDPTKEALQEAWALAISPEATYLAPSVLAYGLARTGNADDALDVINTCLRCKEAHPCTDALHAAALLEIGQIDAACQLVESAISARCGLIPVLLREPVSVELQKHPSHARLWSEVFGNQNAEI